MKSGTLINNQSGSKLFLHVIMNHFAYKKNPWFCHLIMLNVNLQFACAFEEWKQKETTQVEDAENDSIIVKEKKLVDKFLIKSGMLRFSFLLECAPPGAIPDPQLVAAMLELVGFELVMLF